LSENKGKGREGDVSRAHFKERDIRAGRQQKVLKVRTRTRSEKA